MISWIQNHLIRHGRWIFLSLLAVVIIAFVFTIGNTPGCATDRTGYEPREFYGYDLNSRRDMRELGRKVSLSAQLSGRPLRSERQFQSQVTRRIALLHLADELNIPGPTQEQLGEYIREKPAFRGQDGNFDRDAYTRFIDRIESNPQTPDGRVVSVLEEDYRLDQVEDLLAGPGYVLPSEARAQVRQNRTKLALALARRDYGSFDPGIEADEEELRDFYEQDPGRYEIPERIEASYVVFATEDFEDEVEIPAEEDLRSHFENNRERFAESDAGSEDAESDGGDAAEPAFEDVREAVADDYIRRQARRKANQTAENFALTLYREEIPRDSGKIDQIVEKHGGRLRSLDPFTAEEVENHELPSDFLRSAFQLTEKRYYSSAHPIENGFAVLLYEGRIPSEIPPFEDVTDQVAADYRREVKRERFQKEGERLRSELKALMEEGTEFAEAAEQLGLEVRSFDPFTIRQAPRELPRPALERARSMKADELSPMITTGNDGLFVYLRDKEIPEIEPSDEDFTRTRDFLGRLSSRFSANAAVGELITRGLPEDSADPALR